MPTWGVRQPGHAAMTRWTPDGWVTCLGGGMGMSWWGDQVGPDFLLETQARNACGSEAAFAQNVLRLQWVAAFWNEGENAIRREGQPDPNSPWYTLGLMQRRRWAPRATNALTFPRTEGGAPNKILALIAQSEAAPSASRAAIARDDRTGTIVVPATDCSDPAKATNKVLFLPSFLGGQQLFVKEDAEIEYILPQSFLKGDSVKYSLTCRVATAHRSEQPIHLTAGGAVYSITLPYTMGVWGDTEPVVVELEGSADCNLRFARPQQLFGFSIKDFRLVPL